jgi:hypothetical protein
VLVLQTLGAPQRRLLRGKRPKDAPRDAGPEPVPTSRATLVGVRPFEDERRARRWLEGADLDDEVDVFVDVLNRVLHAQRLSTADPFTREVAHDMAIVLRVGIGDGDRLAEGRWIEAKELPRPAAPTGEGPGAGRGRKASAALRPLERFAALLGGRDVALACEELLLRARLDLDRGRDREAALQLRAAYDAALAELPAWASRGGMADRLAELEELRDAVDAAAAEALRGGLGADTVQALELVTGRLEAALRARTASGID